MQIDSVEMKHKLTNMFAWFHAFCVENDLRYYALGGTMLGAVRHQGFIPWDDDVDVGMPRKDYERLISIYESSVDLPYILETPKTAQPDYLYIFSKLYDPNTTLIENTRAKIKRGLYIDVFPLDGLGNTEQTAKKWFKAIDMRYKLLLTRATGVRKGRSKLKNLAVYVGRMIPNAILNNRKLQLKVDKMCTKYDFDSSKYGGNLLGAWRYKEVMPTAVMGKPTEYQFEGLTIWGAQDYDSYLTGLYGDWRQLPPENKRVSHHDFLSIDLHKSYLQKD